MLLTPSHHQALKPLLALVKFKAGLNFHLVNSLSKYPVQMKQRAGLVSIYVEPGTLVTSDFIIFLFIICVSF